MADETDVTGEVARVRPVIEFHVTYFGMSELEADALLDLYADHAYKFAERHGHETPLIGSRSWPTVEAWEGEGPNGAQIAAHAPAGATQGGSGAYRTSDTLSTRLRAAADYQDRPGAYDELRAMADEAHRLEVHARVVEQSLRRVRAEGDEANTARTFAQHAAGREHERAEVTEERLRMVRDLAGAIRETSHCSHLATDIETLLDTPIEELRALDETTENEEA